MAAARTGKTELLALFGVAIAIFGLVILNRCLSSDSLVCEEGACVLERKVPVPFGSLQAFRRDMRAQDIAKLEQVTTEAKSGDSEYLVTYKSNGVDEVVNIRFHLDERGAGDARRYFADPKGRLALVGPRRTRDYPFAAMVLGLAFAAFLAAYKQWKASR